MPIRHSLSRRSFLGVLAAAGAGAVLRPAAGASQVSALLTRPIPSSKEALPLIGLGSWITFNVGEDEVARASCADVMRAFFVSGGRMIDSSPMYGSSQAVIGYGLAKLGHPSGLFAADKVWTSSGDDGPAQIEETRALWGIPRFDLLQVHNLLAWEDHLATLFAMKAEGKLRHVGITTSHGRRHPEIEAIMKGQPIDFVQVTYNALDREVEQRILPLAMDKGIAVIVNRPFRQGELIGAVQRYPLPDWAAEFGAANWAQILLKFIVAHPAVACAIPATSKMEHLQENMGAARGALPDEAMRRRIVAHVEQL
jgi:diketogulonate reductase-like aldo/keto reductase